MKRLVPELKTTLEPFESTDQAMRARIVIPSMLTASSRAGISPKISLLCRMVYTLQRTQGIAAPSALPSSWHPGGDMQAPTWKVISSKTRMSSTSTHCLG